MKRPFAFRVLFACLASLAGPGQARGDEVPGVAGFGAVTPAPSVSTAPAAVPPGMAFAALPRVAPEPPDNPGTPSKVALGRLLFFDPVLSSTGDVSCATCHDPRWGWGDGRPTPLGVGGVGSGPGRLVLGAASSPALDRNTPSLLNVGFNGLVSGAEADPGAAPMFWDSRVQGLEAQALVPIRTRGEMLGGACRESEALPEALSRVRAIPEYRERFRSAFGASTGESVTAENLARAIAAFERTLATPDTAFDRFIAGDVGALSVQQQEGFRRFREAGCGGCHGGPMFSDFKRHHVGVPDGTPGGQRGFRTPTLRNLRHTAPYLHNGSRRRVRDVLAFYDELGEAISETLDGGAPSTGLPLDPLLVGLSLGPEDFPALEAFLDSLSCDDYDRTVPRIVPSGRPVAGAEESH